MDGPVQGLAKNEPTTSANTDTTKYELEDTTVTCTHNKTKIICDNYQEVPTNDKKKYCVKVSEQVTQNSVHTIRLIEQAIGLGWLTSNGTVASEVVVRYVCL